MSLNEICVAKQKILCLRIVLQPTFSNVPSQQPMRTDKQTADNDNNA
jgi:hypothetical protein